MVYNKRKRFSVLKSPYKYHKGKKSSLKMRRLRGKLNRMNNATRKSGDYIQSKRQFRSKIQNIADVPKVHYYGTDLNKIREVIMGLDEFVLKPNHLSRGIGIRILKRDGRNFTDLNGDVLTLKDVIDECSILSKVKRYKGIKAIIIEKRILTHPKLNPHGFADVRMFYFKNKFLLCVARMGNKNSNGYGNTNRGASWGVSLNGKFINSDPRFIVSGNLQGEIFYFEQMVNVGKKVATSFGLIFQTIDMTVTPQGEVVVLESEQMPQIQYYLTDQGVTWLDGMTGTPLRIKGSRNKNGLSAYFPNKVRRSH